ncbi:Fe(3+) ABC transporter substrate-binding protein [Ahrensia sp. R2A130]|uniref:Fe(3+) ABC transporter substrate-binding protein n=1 Tax=Ahrensia sp. R2A130 TaxID=744979 RepID=UPI0001E0D83F|nr:Fe(3+) ABC transporter substrate-binding protein [Ahrensia sp. R2A130]EFL89285.1 iron uptake protein A1 [Ahrensia sp. R2A130]
MTSKALRNATLAALVGAASFATPSYAEGELNLYSSRHYDTDERLYSDFTAQTGITINRIEGKADELIERMKAEGANSPADVLLTVDTTRLERAKTAGVLQSTESAVLEERIPANLQDADNQWFGFSQRARIFFYDKADVTEPPQTYVALADPKYKGQVCHRSSTNVYTQTLLSAVIENHGAEAAKAWAQGVVDNFAREPQGGDTDQLRGLVSGECDISVSNTYYFARSIRKDVKGLPADARENIGFVFPKMTETAGAHVNLSGGGVAKNSPNKANAVKFLEYLASDSAQQYFSAGNDEYPAVSTVALSDSVKQLGTLEADPVDLSKVAQNLEEAQKIFAAVGWK